MQRWIGWTVDEIVRDMASPAFEGVGEMKLRDAVAAGDPWRSGA
jgi:hypothetical protein